MRFKRLIVISVWLVSGGVLAACTAGGNQHPAGSPGTGQGVSPDAQTAAIVACYRAHGDPSFPDPVYDPSDGRWHFAISPATAPESTRRACQHLFPSANASPARPAGSVREAGAARRVHPPARGARLAGPGSRRCLPAAAAASAENAGL